MYSFKNDYSEGAHPKILKKLGETNALQMEGYGEDVCCLSAAGLIREETGRPDADVHFIAGGTLTNLIALSAFLRPHEAVISADTGHIAVHETGAIEATGHKVFTVKTNDGKLCPGLIESALRIHTDEHMVKPRLVYISDTTELGTHYTLSELKDLSSFCSRNGLILFVDGARLGSALTLKDSDVTMADVARYADAFYVGGTKNGALFGEALVITNVKLKEDFRYLVKQRGALLAKGRALGVQFLALFEDGLYYELAVHANEAASALREGISRLGYSFMSGSVSNQLFPILPDAIIDKLKEHYDFHVFQLDENGKSYIRLVTSWATDNKNVLEFLCLLGELSAEFNRK